MRHVRDRRTTIHIRIDRTTTPTLMTLLRLLKHRSPLNRRTNRLLRLTSLTHSKITTQLRSSTTHFNMRSTLLRPHRTTHRLRRTNLTQIRHSTRLHTLTLCRRGTRLRMLLKLISRMRIIRMTPMNLKTRRLNRMIISTIKIHRHTCLI